MNTKTEVKDCTNNQKRTMKVTKQEKKKLLEYNRIDQQTKIKELEQKVKKSQIMTFLKILPMITIGEVITTLTEPPKEEKEKQQLQELKEHLNKSGVFSEKITKEVGDELDEQIKYLEEQKKVDPEGITIFPKKTQNNVKIPLENEEILEIDLDNPSKTETYPSTLQKHSRVEVKEAQQTTIPIKEVKLSQAEEKLDRLKNHKIVEEYENNLKDARKDLRDLTFEYNLLEQQTNQAMNSAETEELLEKLNTVIKRVEELKKLLQIENISQYDANDLYALIEDHLKDFKDKKSVLEIKDSNLYILMAEKVEELEKRKTSLEEKIKTKKEELEMNEKQLEEIKEKYFDFEKFSTKLLQFQNEQDTILKEINEKLAKATTLKEKVEIQVTSIRRRNRSLLSLIAEQMMIPGARSAKRIAIATAISLFFMKTTMQQETRVKKYKVINVTDYQKEIETSLTQLNDISLLLKKTSRQLDKIISDFKREYQQYFAIVPECKALLNDLERVKDSLSEKEYELEKIKGKQQQNLEKNNVQVKKYQLD